MKKKTNHTHTTKIGLVVGVLALSGCLFSMKHAVIRLERNLRSIEAKIFQEHNTIKALRAEWAFLNHPKRLEKLAHHHLPHLKPAHTTPRLPAPPPCTLLAP